MTLCADRGFRSRWPVAACVILASLSATCGCGGTGTESRASPLTRISNQGARFMVHSRREVRLLRRGRVDIHTLRLLAIRDGIGILIAQSTGPGPCFLVSRGRRIGLAACGPTKYPFPSAKLPDIDLSALAAKPGQHHPLISTLSGVTADAVSRVAVRFVRGPKYSVPVLRNTYIARHVPQRPALMVIALDRQGHTLMRIPLPVPPAIQEDKAPKR